MKVVILERNSVGTDMDVSCFEKYGEVKYYPNTVDEIEERVADADIIVANKAPINEKTIGNCPNVKLVCEFATGFDNVDLKYTRERGINVCNVVNYSTAAVAQHTLTLALNLLEHISWYDNYVKGSAYENQDRFSNFDLPYCELEGKTWGIIGMGNIGKRVAEIAKAFGCKVIFYSVTGKSSVTEYEQVSFDELLKESDVLSIHCPLSDITRHLINYDALSKMKKSAILINVARGPVVDNKDLAKALNEGTIAAAGLDVLEQEPIIASNPLNDIKDSTKLIITPHMAWASTEARQRVIDEVCLNIDAFLRGERRNVVN